MTSPLQFLIKRQKELSERRNHQHKDGPFRFLIQRNKDILERRITDKLLKLIKEGVGPR